MPLLVDIANINFPSGVIVNDFGLVFGIEIINLAIPVVGLYLIKPGYGPIEGIIMYDPDGSAQVENDCPVRIESASMSVVDGAPCTPVPKTVVYELPIRSDLYILYCVGSDAYTYCAARYPGLATHAVAPPYEVYPVGHDMHALIPGPGANVPAGHPQHRKAPPELHPLSSGYEQ